MLTQIFDYFLGILFGFLLILLFFIFLAISGKCIPFPRNDIIQNRQSKENEIKEETLHWLNSLLINPINKVVESKIREKLQSSILDFPFSSYSLSILRDIKIQSVNFPTISSSQIQSQYRVDNSLLLTFNINLDSPLIVNLACFVNSIDDSVSSTVLITQLDPILLVSIPYENGDTNITFQFGSNANIEIKSNESPGFVDDILQGIFQKIIKQIDVEFDEDQIEDGEQNSPQPFNSSQLFEDSNHDEIEEEEEVNDDVIIQTPMRFDSSCQTPKQNKSDLYIEDHPSIAITALQTSIPVKIIEQQPIVSKAEVKEMNTQTDPLPQPKPVVQIQPPPPKAKLSIHKDRTGSFEKPQKELPPNKLHYQEIANIFKEEEDIPDEDDRFSLTSNLKPTVRDFNVD